MHLRASTRPDGPASHGRARHRLPAGALAPLLVAGAIVLLPGCASTSSTSSGTTASGPTTTAAAGPGGSSATPSSAPGASTTAGSAGKVSANTASDAEIQKALEAAGVPNAARWTREVTEYRPYPTDDPSLAKLKKELQKYNPSPDTLNKILSALTP